MEAVRGQEEMPHTRQYTDTSKRTKLILTLVIVPKKGLTLRLACQAGAEGGQKLFFVGAKVHLRFT